MREFSSNLAQKLNDFIDYKHTLGIKYETSRVYLLELDQYKYESLVEPAGCKRA